ncbi:MAG: FecR domain-containing protein [Ruegeria sp.]
MAPAVCLANIGTVISAKQGAEITRNGKTQTVRTGMEVLSGDAIQTDRSGVVQLVFVDETKIAIGPNASMVLDVTMLRGNRKAKNFAVKALGGSFRFISGKSKKRAYSISTPTATMAIRGTIFDMWVAPQNQSAMVVLQGTVQMCGLGGSCRSTGRICSLFATTQTGGVGRPKDQDQYNKALATGFPFVQSQAQLLQPFQTDVEGCAGEEAPIKRIKVERFEPRREPPPSPEPARAVKAARAAAPQPAAAPYDPQPYDPQPYDPQPEDPQPEDPQPEDAQPEDPQGQETGLSLFEEPEGSE